MRRALNVLTAGAALLLLSHPTPVRAEGDPFVIANYPVDAVADNAAQAQQQALSNGRRAALRSLFKRLIPVTGWSNLPKLRDVDPTRLISRVSVRSAENSSTQYVASLDFTFDADGVRDVLRKHNVTFVDEPASDTVLVTLAVVADPSSKSGIRLVSGSREFSEWAAIWKDLDLTNAIAPLKLATPRPVIDAEAIAAARAGDPRLLTLLATTYSVPRVVLAVVEQETKAQKLKVTIAGQDAVGPLVINRVYPYRPGDLGYTMEMAAVVALGTLEGRWKSIQAGAAAAAQSMGPLEPVQLFVEFRSMQQWQQLRDQIAATPGVQDLQIGGMSSAGADVALRFPGGGRQLSAALANRGITVRADGGTWVARQGY